MKKQRTFHTGSFKDLPILATGVLFLISFYWAVLKVVRPAFLYVQQMPVFVPTERFMGETLQIPGGPIDLLASFLMLRFTSEWVGALILTVCCALLLLILSGVFQERTMLPGFGWLIFLPPIAFTLMLTDYERPLTGVLSLLFSTGFYWIFTRFENKAPALRLIFFAVSGCVLYYLTPGGFLIYMALAAVSQAPRLVRRPSRAALIGLAAAMAWAVPTAAANRVFLIGRKDAFLKHLPFVQYDVSQWPFYLFVILLTGLAVLASVRPKESKTKESKTKENRLLSRPAVVFGLVVAIPLLNGLLSVLAVNRVERKVLEIRTLAHENRWRDLLEAVDMNAIRHVTCMTLINQALYHTDQLASHMFNFGQPWKTAGLILPRDLAYEYPLEHCRIVFDMGHVTEAERWASEAMVLYGPTPWVLERQALINILQDDRAAATKYLRILSMIGPTRNWAEHYAKIVDEPDRLRYEHRLLTLKALKPTENFITSIVNPQTDFQKLLEQNPDNRMAYEYLMAYALLARDLRLFTEYLPMYTRFQYGGMPRHYQEALLVFLSQKGRIELPGFQPDPRIVQRFRQFTQTMQQVRTAGAAGLQRLKNRFGDTYWYYLIYSQIENGTSK